MNRQESPRFTQLSPVFFFEFPVRYYSSTGKEVVELSAAARQGKLGVQVSGRFGAEDLSTLCPCPPSTQPTSTNLDQPQPTSTGHAQVQGLGDVLEIEENLVSGDDGVKIQDCSRRTGWV